jgi:methionyl-tRNA synthetase
MGVVTAAEPVEDADKLLRLEIDLGFEERQILAGIAEHMTTDEIKGRNVVVVANLAPKTMFGLESQGMVLMAEDRDGNLAPISADAEPGSVVR